jgi:flavin-binding protein dodecin
MASRPAPGNPLRYGHAPPQAISSDSTTTEDAMADHVYKLTEIVGTSHDGQDAAIEAALERAHKSLRNVRWFEVVAQRGYVEESGALIHQVTLKVGFTLDG